MSKKIKSRKFVLLSSPEMKDFGDKICKQFEAKGVMLRHLQIEYTRFANGEYLPRIPESIRGQHVFLLHDLQYPDPNIQLMKMLIVGDAIKRASARSITLVLPFVSYLRQDRKDKPRVPITARLVANLIEENRLVRGMITMDMHAEAEQGFFDIPVDNLHGFRVFADYLKKELGESLDNVFVLAPDFGGAVRNSRLAEALGGLEVGVFRKRRTGPNKAEIMDDFVGSVKDRVVVVYEDMICSGGTAVKTIEKILALGAKKVYFCATHGIFSANAEAKFAGLNAEVICTDSIPRSAEYMEEFSYLKRVSVADYFAEAMYQYMLIGGSISKLCL